MSATIIGIDCATKAEKVGLARGYFDGDKASIEEVSEMVSDVETTVVHWIKGSSYPALLALDAPLGWPKRLGEALICHEAGKQIKEADPNKMFSRRTDRVVEDKVFKNKKRPLEVGANLIARTAHATLDLLHRLRQSTGQEILLARDPGMITKTCAIEVYPAATLAACCPELSDYKRKGKENTRQKVVDLLKTLSNLDLLHDPRQLERDINALVAAICVLAGADFLRGNVIKPDDVGIDLELVEKEGWIWVRKPE